MTINQAKLRKIAELARNGVGGERENALRILTSAGISVEDIDEILEAVEEVDVEFKYRTKFERTLTLQTLFKILNVNTFRVLQWKKSFTVLVPSDRMAECQEAVKTILSLYRKELEKFEIAFIYKNQLYSDVDTDEKEHGEFLSQEEITEIDDMMRSIKRAHLERQLPP